VGGLAAFSTYPTDFVGSLRTLEMNKTQHQNIYQKSLNNLEKKKKMTKNKDAKSISIYEKEKCEVDKLRDNFYFFVSQ